jgi:uncharacterized protein (DUF1810 family)
MHAPTQDPFDLARFERAQANTYTTALAELRRGLKTTHWMWYVFPQMRGLGSSAESVRYSISGLDEARAYLAHAVLGARLRECAEAVLAVTSRSAEEILGPVDAMKLRSCATLFAEVAEPGSVFARVLARFFNEVGESSSTDRAREERPARG